MYLILKANQDFFFSLTTLLRTLKMLSKHTYKLLTLVDYWLTLEALLCGSETKLLWTRRYSLTEALGHRTPTTDQRRSLIQTLIHHVTSLLLLIKISSYFLINCKKIRAGNQNDHTEYLLFKIIINILHKLQAFSIWEL